MKDKIVFLDMDGVLADFISGIGYAPESVNEHGQPYYEDPKEMYNQYFFEYLDPLPFAKEAVAKLLSEYNVELHIASKPLANEFCASEKYIWVAKHFPALLKRTHLLQEKGLLLGDYLVDDDLRWRDKFKGTMIHFNTSNPQESWEKVLETLKDYKK